MKTIRLCPNCNAPLPPDAPAGLCPVCLLKTDPATKLTTEGGAQAAPSKLPPPPPLSEIARHFPQLEILELIGQGGMGIVYKARQPKLDRLIALKVLPAEAGRDPAFAERFAREARALAKLNHPGIVAIYDYGSAGPFFYLIMEYVDGVNLRQMIQTQQIKPQEALGLVMQICEALQFAHDQGVVHRDIKPGNILANRSGRVKIADFGLAKLLGQAVPDYTLTGSQHFMGTPNYMAPEQASHPQQVDHRADIYSLGVVFYEMLTGELPMGRFPLPSQKVQVDVRLDEIVLHTLERDVERRYQHASEVKTAVENVSSTPQAAPVASPPPAAATFPEPAIKPRLSRFALAGAVLAALAPPLVSSAVIVYLMYRPSTAILLLTILCGTLGLASLLGSTICGGIAIGHIKRPGGKIYGLPLAVADLLLLPLLAVAALMVFLPVPIPLLHMLLIPVVPFFVARAVWRKIAPVASPLPAPETARLRFRDLPADVKAAARKRISFVAAGFCLCAVLGLWLLPSCFNQQFETRLEPLSRSYRLLVLKGEFHRAIPFLGEIGRKPLAYMPLRIEITGKDSVTHGATVELPGRRATYDTSWTPFFGNEELLRWMSSDLQIDLTSPEAQAEAIEIESLMIFEIYKPCTLAEFVEEREVSLKHYRVIEDHQFAGQGMAVTFIAYYLMLATISILMSSRIKRAALQRGRELLAASK